MKLAGGLGLAAAAVGSFLAGPLPLAVFVGVLYVLAYAEFRALLAPGIGSTATLALGALGVGGFVAAAHLREPVSLPWIMAGLLLATLVVRIVLAEAARRPADGATLDVAATTAAAGVAGLLGAHLLLVRAIPRFGFRGTLVLGLMVFLNQALAFVVGRVAGRHPLAPALAADKTWEGAAAGTAASLVVGLVAGLVSDPPFTVASGLVLGACMAVAAPAGDLAVAAVRLGGGGKAHAGWLPGRGSALDAVDGLLFSAPIFYWAYRTLVI